MNLAKGLSLLIGNAGIPTETYSPVTDILEFNLSGASYDVVDVSCMDDPSLARKWKKTLRTDGELTLTLLWDSANTNHNLMRTLSKSSAERNFRVQYAGSTLGTVDFTALLTDFKFGTEIDTFQTAEITLVVNGALIDKAATIAALTIADTAGPAYISGEIITLSARFDEVVVVTGFPRIQIVMTSGTKNAFYVSGSGTNVLSFGYTFVGGDSATATHVSFSSPIQTNGGSILDQSGQPAVLSFTSPSTSTITVN